MCRATQVCSELGSDAETWSKISPLHTPAWFGDEFRKFVDAIHAAADKNIERSRQLLAKVRGEEMKRWYLNHGQNSGVYRFRNFGVSRPSKVGTDSGAAPASMVAAVYMRDHYHCRYCNIKIVPPKVLKAYQDVVGIATFAATLKNDSHGAALVFRPTPDHVEPLSCGGAHDMSNLVTACYPCNFGKVHYTVEQLGIEDPRVRPPVSDGWDGLMSLLPKLKAARFAG